MPRYFLETNWGGCEFLSSSENLEGVKRWAAKAGYKAAPRTMSLDEEAAMLAYQQIIDIFDEAHLNASAMNAMMPKVVEHIMHLHTKYGRR